MLVFLDFDGVLHPFPCHYGVFFCQRAVLEKFFGRPEYKSAQFVITSTWRNRHPLEALREWIALDDMQQFFEPECRNLFLCDGSTGLTEADYPRLVAHIARLEQTQKAT